MVRKKTKEKRTPIILAEKETLVGLQSAVLGFPPLWDLQSDLLAKCKYLRAKSKRNGVCFFCIAKNYFKKKEFLITNTIV